MGSHSNLKHPENGAGNSESNSSDFDDFIYLLSHDVRNSIRALIEVPQWIGEDLLEDGHAITGSLARNMPNDPTLLLDSERGAAV